MNGILFNYFIIIITTAIITTTVAVEASFTEASVIIIKYI